MLEPTRDEPGCLTYELLQSVVDRELFFVYGIWQDETCVENHSHTKHALAFKNVAPDLLEGPVLLNKVADCRVRKTPCNVLFGSNTIWMHIRSDQI
jgi:quinol monooxygenase YgiN